MFDLALRNRLVLPTPTPNRKRAVGKITASLMNLPGWKGDGFTTPRVISEQHAANNRTGPDALERKDK